MTNELDRKGLAAAVREFRLHIGVGPDDAETIAEAAIIAYLAALPSDALSGTEKTGVQTTIWIVGATVGEWSDRREWTVGAWESQVDAEAFVEQISALGRIFEQAAVNRFNSDESEAEAERAEAACKAVDASWSDYCGEATRYTCWEETLRRSLSALERAPTEGWMSMESAPRDGTWIIARCNDGSDVHRISWGRNRFGHLAWCSGDRSFGDGLFSPFGGWIPCPQPAAPLQANGDRNG